MDHDVPRCLLCGSTEVEYAALFLPKEGFCGLVRTTAIGYRLCAVCFALPEPERVTRAENYIREHLAHYHGGEFKA